ncbi:MAG: hypothetical protein QOF84_3842 [Streptomyces sp.]|nr:hypothetical protein [Streptomyces sp.]
MLSLWLLRRVVLRFVESSLWWPWCLLLAGTIWLKIAMILPFLKNGSSGAAMEGTYQSGLRMVGLT